jgi:hypothetical protein
MAATGSYNAVTDILTVTGDGLPTPVGYGTFPNPNNPNSVTSYTFSHSFIERGGDNTTNSGTVPLGIVGISANGVAFFNPSAGDGGSPPQGFQFLAAGENPQVNFGEDTCGGHPEQTGQYHYHDSHFIDCWKQNQVMAGYNDYYGSSQYKGDNMRHPDGHSKILGYCFDGYPVYGPYGYSDPNSNVSAITTMRTGYSLRETEAVNRPSYDVYPAGSFVQDYVYSAELPGKHLDAYNGRYGVTPEYPSGTFAYFVSIEPDETEQVTYQVTVSSEENGNKYRLDGELYPDLTFIRGSTYIFNQDNISNNVHPFHFSTSENGIHSSGTPYNEGVTYYQDGVEVTYDEYWNYSNFISATTRRVHFTVPDDAPNTLYYWCYWHPNMAESSTITVRDNKYGTPKFPFIFGLASKEQLNIPDNQGIGQDEVTPPPTEPGQEPEAPSLIINNQPTNATTSASTNVTFTVLAEVQPENAQINYQWQVSSDGGFSWSNITGAHSPTLSFIALAYMTGYRYRVILTGPVGAAPAENSPLASNLSILTVTGADSEVDLTAVLKLDNSDGRFDMTAITFDRDNNNPTLATTTIRFDSTSYDFDLT